MKLQISMELDNSAFDENYLDEVERILMDLISRLPVPLTGINGALTLRDINGNYVGKAEIIETKRKETELIVRKLSETLCNHIVCSSIRDSIMHDVRTALNL